jgi:hypothetical protein
LPLAARGSLSRKAHFREGQIVISFETEFVEQAQDFAFVFVSGPGTGKTHWLRCWVDRQHQG